MISNFDGPGLAGMIWDAIEERVAANGWSANDPVADVRRSCQLGEMARLIKKLKSVFYFVRAGDAFDHKDYELARARIGNAIRLAGGSDASNSLFEYFLRAAWIERQFCADKSSARLQEARRRIEATSSLKAVDRDYLLSFCDIFDAELRAVNAPQPRLAKSEWERVQPHHRRDYPLV